MEVIPAVPGTGLEGRVCFREIEAKEIESDYKAKLVLAAAAAAAAGFLLGWNMKRSKR